MRIEQKLCKTLDVWFDSLTDEQIQKIEFSIGSSWSKMSLDSRWSAFEELECK